MTQPNRAREDVPEMTVKELARRMELGHPLTLVDVRELHEKEIADLPDYGQRRIPVADFLEQAETLDPSAPVVLYCRSGSRSEWATRKLLELGHRQAWNLKGGILAWRKEIDPSLQAY